MFQFLVLVFLTISVHSYRLVDDYSPDSFADKFNFFIGTDPTHGFVKYVDRGTANQMGIFKVENNKVYIGVDKTNRADNGRSSVRLESKATYNRGLFILDLDHMPGSVCGTWPAFWLLGTGVEWPQNGEIDVIEGVNTQASNSMALHTNQGCAIVKSGDFSGEVKSFDCYNKNPQQFDNQGCQITSNNQDSYGNGFNAANGGVYATEWTSDAIRVWHFPRSRIPGDIQSGNPNPNSWEQPLAKFAGACNINEHFRDMQIILNIAMCGDWAGQPDVWKQQCGNKAPDCVSFVRDQANAFEQSYWLVNSLKVYQ